MIRTAVTALAAAATLTGCKLPDVNLTTSDPLKVDINVKLDVYQHGKPGDAPAGSAASTAEVRTEPLVRERQRNRGAEIQTLKNNRLVGENHRGLLTIRDLPAGDYGDYVKRTVGAENEDRVFLMVDAAKKENLQMHEVQDREWKALAERAFAGEWIEQPGDREGTFKWVQKK